jgi:hypothetical protein
MLNKWSSKACDLCKAKQVLSYVVRSYKSHFGFHQKAHGRGVHTTFNLFKKNQSAQVMCKCGMKGSPMIFFLPQWKPNEKGQIVKKWEKQKKLVVDIDFFSP